ncbi:MAG: nitrous oxide reductase family maturation protein NosD [Campylobacterales bacterium]|nr:nitrous oxide reductase family maturation protein NosD [Campylobacterales bacterium]
MKIVMVLLAAALHVMAQNTLQEAIDAAAAGSMIRLPEGVFKGRIVIDKPLHIIGADQKSIIDGEGEGTVVTIKSSHVTLENLRIQNSGDQHYKLDAAVLADGVEDLRIEGCHIEDTLFGIDFQMVHHSHIVGNTIISKDFDLGVRGDGVRLWYSNDNVVAKNRLYRSRDMVIWYSHGNLIEKNVGEECRYSLHFMYAGANTIRNNRYLKNSVGIFFMYSRDSVATGNLVQSSLGSTGIGIGLKEVSNFTIKGNTVLYCARGFYIDWSPFEPETTNTIENNKILYNAEGIHFHAYNKGNRFAANSLIGNIDQVINDTKKASIVENFWEGNYWDDYQGFDKNQDGIGDTPYHLHEYIGRLWQYKEDAKFFYGTPLVSLINFLTKLAPFSEPEYLLTDTQPRFHRSIHVP